MKTASLAITLAFLAAPALVAPANAGEGQGAPFALTTGGKTTTTWTAGKVGSSQNPFPYTAAPATTSWVAGRVGSSQNPFPFTGSGMSYSMAPEANTGSTRPVQSAQAPVGGSASAQQMVR
jgi:hypothetical protein